MRLFLFKGKSFVSRLIEWQTRSVYSHVAIAIEGSRVIEAIEGEGVRTYTYSIGELTNADVFHVDTTVDQEEIITQFLYKQLGKKYDYSSVLRFISRRQESRTGSGKWFCSELAFAAFQKADINLLERIEPWAVSPALLANSPLVRDSV